MATSWEHTSVGNNIPLNLSPRQTPPPLCVPLQTIGIILQCVGVHVEGGRQGRWSLVEAGRRREEGGRGIEEGKAEGEGEGEEGGGGSV